MRSDGYLTRFSPGPAWVTGRPIEEQPGYARQVRWWISMRRRGLLSWAGIPVQHPEQILVRWHVGRLGEARKMAASAPFVRGGILREATLATATRA
jgi:hypothetical protein